MFGRRISRTKREGRQPVRTISTADAQKALKMEGGAWICSSCQRKQENDVAEHVLERLSDDLLRVVSHEVHHHFSRLADVQGQVVGRSPMCPGHLPSPGSPSINVHGQADGHVVCKVDNGAELGTIHTTKTRTFRFSSLV